MKLPKEILFSYKKTVNYHHSNSRVKLPAFGNFTRAFLLSLSFCALVLFSTLQVQAQSWLQFGSEFGGNTETDFSVSAANISADGKIVAIIASRNNGDQGPGSSYMRVYEYKNSKWEQLGADIQKINGRSISLSADGKTVAIGAPSNDGNGYRAGHVRVYKYNTTTSAWTQLGADIDGEAAFDHSGWSVSLSADGKTVAIGAPFNSGNAVNSGHVRVYEYKNNNWEQLGADIDGEDRGDNSGQSVSLSADGKTVAIGAPGNNGNGRNSGHVRVYKYTAAGWKRLGLDINGEDRGDNSGQSVSLSADGKTVAIGAPSNDGNGTKDSGHVRVYKYNTTTSAWTQLGADIDGEAAFDQSGSSVSLSADGKTVAIRVSSNNRNGGSVGHVRVYKYTDAGTTSTSTTPPTVAQTGGITKAWTKVGANIFHEKSTLYSPVISADGKKVAIIYETGRHSRNKRRTLFRLLRVYKYFFTITSPYTVTISENEPLSYTAKANNKNATFSLTGTGNDNDKFTIDSSTGAVKFKRAPDFENPTDANKDNVYNIQITATAGSQTVTKDVTITVTNDPIDFTSGATATVEENTTKETVIYTAMATPDDASAGNVTFSLKTKRNIYGYLEPVLFTIDSSTGAVKFKRAPDFETPADADQDNVYNIQIIAKAGTGADEQTATRDVMITVTNEVEAPVFVAGTPVPSGTPPTVDVAENTPTTTTVYTAEVRDASRKDEVTFSLEAPSASVTADDDNDKFTIGDVVYLGGFSPTKVKGAAAIKFVSVPDFETPADADKDNVYNIQITAKSGTGTNAKTITHNVTITVTDNSDEIPPMFTSGDMVTLPENTSRFTTLYTATATDKTSADSDITFSKGGKDGLLFSMGKRTGKLEFYDSPDYENPRDANKDNKYEVEITARDKAGNTVSKAVTIMVTNVVEPPAFWSSLKSEVNVPENTPTNMVIYTAYLQIAPKKDAVTLFSLEAPAAGTAADDDNDKFTFDGKLVYGTGTGRSTKSKTTKIVKFKKKPDFENPADADKNNVYNIQITAKSGTGTNAKTITHNVTITVTDNSDEIPPMFTSGDMVTLPENTSRFTTLYTATATDKTSADSDITFSKGGKDGLLFSMGKRTGKLEFYDSPDYENPRDANKDNKYEVEITARDKAGNTATKAVTITVINVVEPPTFSSALKSEVNVLENTPTNMVIYTAELQVSNRLTDPVTFSLEAPAAATTLDDDNDKFTIDDKTGAVKFKEKPDFENPVDKDGNNEYQIQITAKPGKTNNPFLIVTYGLTIVVTDVVDAATPLKITSAATATVAENTTNFTYMITASKTATFALGTAGGDEALFKLEGAKLSFNTATGGTGAAPDFENPKDADKDNVYKLELKATDAVGNEVKMILSIEVTDVDEIAPNITSAATATVPENTTDFTYTITASENATFALGTAGGDEALFKLEGAKLSFNTATGGTGAAPDFENPKDADKDNVYKLELKATDAAGNTGKKMLSITVTDVDEIAPTITSPSTATVAKNTTNFAYTITANEEATFALGTAGGDEAFFKLAANKVSFKAAPDFENPKDADKDNVYKLELKATDAAGNTGKKVLSITVTDVDETAPNITSAATASVPENKTDFTYTITANEAATFALGTAGGDEALFKLTANKVSFKAAPDFENPKDADKDNVYKLELKATDAAGNTGKKVLSITVTDVADQATIALPETLVFADTKVGEMVSKVLTISNPSVVALKVKGIIWPTGFTGNWSSGTIPADGKKEVNVSFKPTEVKAYTGTITVESDATNANAGKNTLSVSGKGILVTGIEPARAAESGKAVFPGLSLFPNPVEDLLNIKLPNQTSPVSLQLVDVNGQVVYERNTVKGDELNIDVSGYKSGVYVLVLRSGGKVEKRKVVIQ